MITYINTSLDPFYNQAFEELIFDSVSDDNVFMLWRNSPAVVVGCYQNICREVKVNKLMQQGIPVIRRMTGGGTVYHDLGNINYSLILQNTKMLDYDECLYPVIKALNEMGIPAGKNRTCDIAIGDKKISGSAQKMVKGRVLHHGTLLYDSQLDILDQITTHHKNENIKTKGVLSAICTVTNISSHIKEKMTTEEFADRLLRQVIDINQKDSVRKLTDTQEKEVLRLAKEKYRSWEWTWGKTPAFTFEKEAFIGKSRLNIAFAAKGGIIHDVKISCDAFDADKASSLLEGARLDPIAIEKICRSVADNYAEELFDIII